MACGRGLLLLSRLMSVAELVAASPQQRRWNEAGKVRRLLPEQLPKFDNVDVWNYSPCEHHDKATPDCQYRKCGGPPFAHQIKTALFSYVARGSIVGNSTGTGKTASALLTLVIAHMKGEPVRAVIVVPSTAVTQWVAETRRWVPGFKVSAVPPKTPKQQRIETYAKQWNVLIIGYHVFTLDYKHILKSNYKQVVVDDVDPMLNEQNATFTALDAICSKSTLTIVMNATIISMRLEQLYAATALIGGRDVWGSLASFKNRHIKKEKVWVTTKSGEKIRTYKAVGYKAMRQFKKKFDPMFIRITYEDLKGAMDIPSLITQQVYLEMSPKQRARYSELQKGVRTILNDKQMPHGTKAVNALAAFVIGSQICSGLFSLKTSSGSHETDGPGASPKLDWIESKLRGEWKKEKVVVYTKYRGAIKALQNRLDKVGIGYASISGANPDPEDRKKEMDRFWEDPNTKVMIISVSGERSLNLQNSRIMVMWDLNLNPGRMTQLAGRVRRVGSKYSHVLVVQLLMENSQEERYIAALAARQALVDTVYDENDENDDDNYLIPKMDPQEILRFISP